VTGIIQSLILIFIFSLGLNAQGKNGKMGRVIIDAGHGGEDTGAFHHGVKESDVVLKISKKLHQRLKKSPYFKPEILRQSDNALTLDQRVRMGRQKNGDIFLSIHANSSPSQKIRGAEFYIQSQMAPEEEMRFIALRENSAKTKVSDPERPVVDDILFDLKNHQRILESFELSRSLKKKWTSSLKKKNRIRQGPFFVLGQNSMPSVLVEVGYLTNSKDLKNLQSSHFQNQIVEKIYHGLKDYWLGRDKRL